MKKYTSPEFKANLFEIEENIMDSSVLEVPNVNDNVYVYPGASNELDVPDSWGN